MSVIINRILFSACALSFAGAVHADSFYNQTDWLNAVSANNPSFILLTIDLNNYTYNTTPPVFPGVTRDFADGATMYDYVNTNSSIMSGIVAGDSTISNGVLSGNFQQKENMGFQFPGMNVAGFSASLTLPTVTSGLYVLTNDRGGFSLPQNATDSSFNGFFGSTITDPYYQGGEYLSLGSLDGGASQPYSINNIELVLVPTPVPVTTPEPATFALLGVSLVGFGATRKLLKR